MNFSKHMNNVDTQSQRVKGYEHSLQCQSELVQILALSFTRCVTTGWLPNFSKPQYLVYKVEILRVCAA